MAAMRDQEASSSSMSRHTYHVFLSFRGKDTRQAFTNHLYMALKWAGIQTFRDDNSIKRGRDIDFDIRKAIHESKMSLIVFSKDYASSRWCLDELLLILERRETVGHIVLPVFYDVDPSEVSQQTGSFDEAFARHEKFFKDRVEEWRVALSKVTDMAGMVLRDRYEAQFIQDIVKEVGDQLNRTILHVPFYLVGMDSRVKDISSWLQDGSDDVGIAIIHGFGGVGKTTIAKTVFNLNFDRFDSWSFLKDVRETSKPWNVLVLLQNQLLLDIMRGEPNRINNVDEGIIKIRDALGHKRVLIVLDDVDHVDQFKAFVGRRDWLNRGSKIIITTRYENLLRSHEACEKFEVNALDEDESLQLFSWHAFHQAHPNKGYKKQSKNVVHHCGGIPLALEVLGSSLSGQTKDLWKRALREPEAIDGDGRIQRILKISYDSLQDDRDKNLFLDIACFFIGKEKDYVDSLLDGCDFYRIVGIQNLIDKCLITIDKDSKLMMHQLLRDMGREIVRQESFEDLGKRSRLWHHDDAFSVLRKNIGTETVKSLILDQQQVNTALTNEVDLTTEAFTKMQNLRLLHLNNVKLNGGYENFPKSLVWLYWNGFSLNCIPTDWSLSDLIILEMCNSSLKHVWKGTRNFPVLKILNLSHSHCLVRTPDFSGLPNLEMLILQKCISLVEVHGSIGKLKRLVLINLKDCKKLRMLPKEMGKLETLENLILSGCSELDEMPEQLGKFGFVRVIRADGTAINQLKMFVSSFWSRLSPRKSMLSPSFNLSFLPHSLVVLSLADCNLRDHVTLNDLSRLPSLESLDLSGNPIHNLPESMNSLTKLKSLLLQWCTKLQSLPELPTSLVRLIASNCAALERITNLPNLLGSLEVDIFGCHNLVEVQGVFKLEPIRNFDVEMINNVRLFNLESVECFQVTMSDIMTLTERKAPLQVFHECGISSIFLPGSEVPDWFYLQTKRNRTTFYVPPSFGPKICGLNICIVYASIKPEVSFDHLYYAKIRIETKGQLWEYSPTFFGLPEANEDMLWLSHWKFRDWLEAGDGVLFSVAVVPYFRMKKCGIHLVYEQQDISTQSSTEDIVQSTSLWYETLTNRDLAAYKWDNRYYLYHHDRLINSLRFKRNSETENEDK